MGRRKMTKRQRRDEDRTAAGWENLRVTPRSKERTGSTPKDFRMGGKERESAGKDGWWGQGGLGIGRSGEWEIWDEHHNS